MVGGCVLEQSAEAASASAAMQSAISLKETRAARMNSSENHLTALGMQQPGITARPAMKPNCGIWIALASVLCRGRRQHQSF
jgi:hypothetical protein